MRHMNTDASEDDAVALLMHLLYIALKKWKRAISKAKSVETQKIREAEDSLGLHESMKHVVWNFDDPLYDAD